MGRTGRNHATYVTPASLSALPALVTMAAGAPKALLKGDVSPGLQ
ncbi:hypothetical protein [Streptomyces coeruleorubidus]